MSTETETRTAGWMELYFSPAAADPMERPCEARRKKCPNVALYKMNWVPGVQDKDACHCGPQELCLACKDWTLSQPDQGSILWQCRVCDGFAILQSVTPLR